VTKNLTYGVGKLFKNDFLLLFCADAMVGVTMLWENVFGLRSNERNIF
jgi:hypothetical protein